MPDQLMQPSQLAASVKAKRGRSTKPILEELPYICIHDLKLSRWGDRYATKTLNDYDPSAWPFISSAKIQMDGMLVTLVVISPR
jgi:hypothetical protein